MDYNILTFKSFDEFYNWMLKNYKLNKEIFVEVKKGEPKDDGKLYYIDAVYMALCFGWIDSTTRSINGKLVQRFSPRVKKSPWTELNKERCKWLEKQGKMQEDGRIALKNSQEFKISQKMLEIINSDKELKENFYKFPEIYQRLRIDSIQRHFPYKDRKEMYEKQIINFIKQTKLVKMYGNMNDYGRITMI